MLSPSLQLTITPARCTRTPTPKPHSKRSTDARVGCKPVLCGANEPSSRSVWPSQRPSPFLPPPPAAYQRLRFAREAPKLTLYSQMSSTLPRRIVKETQRLVSEPGAWRSCCVSECTLLCVARLLTSPHFHIPSSHPPTTPTPTYQLTVPGISAQPYEDNCRYFNVVIGGPESSPYEGACPLRMDLWGCMCTCSKAMFWRRTKSKTQISFPPTNHAGGTFRLELFLPAEYPMAPPKVGQSVKPVS